MRLFLRRSQKEIVRYLLAPQSTGPFQPDRKRLAPDVVVAAMPTAGPTGVFDGRPIFRQYGRSGGAAYVAQVAVGIAGFVVEIIDADDGEDRVAAVRNVAGSHRQTEARAFHRRKTQRTTLIRTQKSALVEGSITWSQSGSWVVANRWLLIVVGFQKRRPGQQ
ncbi:hypothetical protein E4U28_007120 [Claviceps purpurea]|nr:hypothetical protein E4U28_007120 [Claviceps purpurea]